MTSKQPQTLEQKVDELQKCVSLLVQSLLEMDKNISNAIVESMQKSTEGMVKIAKLNEKYTAKLRRIEQKETNFYRWANYILFCVWLILIILMWYTK